jgi:transcriptional regulator with XRE-family HTH domain
MHTEPSLATSNPADFSVLLKGWRQKRGLSQLDLGLETEVSAKHLSFLETGRSRPSRRMVLRLADALEVPFRQRNALLLAAGFAPAYSESSYEDSRLEQVRKSLALLLRRHLPYPAFVLDRFWNIVMSNAAHDRILNLLMAGREQVDPINAIRLVLDPDQLRPLIGNWLVVARTVVRRFERQYQMSGQDEELGAFRDQILALPGVAELIDSPYEPEDDAILVPLQLSIGDIDTQWFTTLATFGAPLDITLQEAVIESLFPADQTTEAFVFGLGQQSS